MPAAPVVAVDEVLRPALLVALRDIVGAADAADGNTVATERLWSGLRRMLERALELLAALQGAEDDAATTQIADLCFAGTMELRRVLRELNAAADDHGRLVAAEACRRKMRRAIRAVLEAAREAGVHDMFGEPGGCAADLASAVAIRRLYARFRGSLRRAADDTPEAVLAAVRYAGFALATLVSEPDYADVRASDRAVLRELRERALQWARGDRAVPAGLHLLDDVFTCGDLLRGINRRQELREQDGALIAALARSPDAETGGWFARLDALFGLDDDLDRLLERTRAVQGDAAALDRLVPEVLVRLAQVQ
jgi:hypothetical protein